MTRLYLILTFVLLGKIGLCQLIPTGGLSGDSSEHTFTFSLDTIRINGDSLFYVLSMYENQILVHREEQILIDGKTNRSIFHGKTEQWYLDGSKKIEGQFEFGKKVGLWKYWDDEGNLTQDVDQAYLGIRKRGDTKFYIDGIPVEIRDD